LYDTLLEAKISTGTITVTFVGRRPFYYRPSTAAARDEDQA
jgi:hypothetical protein